jgi:molecular chaperone IbpA
MTNQLTLRSLDIPSIHKFGIGFDSLFDQLDRIHTNQSNYPPHNVIKHTEDKYDIEIAVAGFKEGDVEITVDNRVLTVSGSRKTAEQAGEYVVRGISSRDFTRTFTLAEHVEVKSATIEDGILTIALEREVPEEKKPKSIAITYNK